MSIPPSKTIPGSVLTRSVQFDGTVVDPGTTRPTTVTKCSSVQPARKKTPFRYRIKTWVYKGQVYTRTKAYIPKSIRFAPNSWRPPLPYSGHFTAGDVTHFNACHSYGQTAPGSKFESTLVGDLGTSNYAVACPALPAFDAGLENKAVIKALGKLKNQQVNLAVAFAERTETAELLVGTLAGLAKAARSLRHGDMKGVARGLGLSGPPKEPKGRTFPQKWLELQYGWKPLYSDVFGCVSALNQRDLDDDKRYTVTVKAREKVPFVRYSNPVTGQICCKAHAVDDGFEGAFVRLDYYLTNPLLATLAQLGITNPLEVAWERVPFSFVVDWFLPVGRYLSALDATLGYTFRAGSCTRLFRRNWSAGIYGTAQPGYVPKSIWGTVNTRVVNIERTVYGTSPLPRVPGFKNPFPQNGVHIANAIALFASSLRK